MKTAFVTGGSGFVGRNLIAYLVQRGVAVRALGRSAASLAAVEAAGAKGVKGDLSGGAEVTEGMRGCDVVFHAAAFTEDWGVEKEAWAATVEGTSQMLKSAKDAGVARFVHVSTEAVLVDGTPLIQVDETRPLPTAPIGIYARTKGAAEQRVRDAVAAGQDAVIVRPRFIWGRGDTTLLPKLIEGAKDGSLQWIGGGGYLTSTCHVQNCCEGLYKAAEKGKSGETYFLTDGTPRPFREVVEGLLKSQDVTPPTRSVPHVLAHFFAYSTDAAWRLFAMKGRPPLPHATFHLIGEEVTVRDDKARRELGYVGEMSVEQGLRELAGFR